MPIQLKSFIAIETSLTQRLQKSWGKVARKTFNEVKKALDARDYTEANLLALKINLEPIIKENLPYMRMAAYSSLVFGASRLTASAKDTVIARGDYSRIVDDAVKQMEITIRGNAEEMVRDKLLTYIDQRFVDDRTTPLSRSQKYDPSQPRDEDGKWTDSGGSAHEFPKSLGILRKDMPQVSSANFDEFVEFANSKGVSVKPDTIVVSKLKPAQSEYNPEQVAQMPSAAYKDKPVLVSSDNYVLDGINRWVRLLQGDKDQEIKVNRIDLPARKALALMKSFPKSTSKDISEIGATKKYDVRKYDPDQPRAPAGSEEGGQWVADNSMEGVFHGTSADLIEIIKKEGLKPGKEWMGRKAAVYMGPETLAIEFAKSRAIEKVTPTFMEWLKTTVGVTKPINEISGVVFKIKIPEGSESDTEMKTIFGEKVPAVYVTRSIPPSDILGHKTFRFKRRKGYGEPDTWDLVQETREWKVLKEDSVNYGYLVVLVTNMVKKYDDFACVIKYDRDQPRAPKGDPEGGQWISDSDNVVEDEKMPEGIWKVPVDERTKLFDALAPKKGDTFIVYRLGAGSGKLVGKNGGNAEGVASYIEDIHDFESVSSSNADTVEAFRVTLSEDTGKYVAAKADELAGGDRVGRRLYHGGIQYSFPSSKEGFTFSSTGKLSLDQLDAYMKKTMGSKAPRVLWQIEKLADLAEIIRGAFREQVFIKKYDENQPRAPKGVPTGGEWVSDDEAFESGEGKLTPAANLATLNTSTGMSESDLLLNLTEAERAQYFKDTLELKADIDANKETYKLHSRNGDGTGGYTEERQLLHTIIVGTAFQDSNKYKSENPTAMILGGRGGSGKSSFNKANGQVSGVYDPKEFLVIDPDEIKNQLAKADGLKTVGAKAYLYHEESSMLAGEMQRAAVARSMNIVVDKTLQNAKVRDVQVLIDNGYKVEGHYMFLPREKAAERALRRYLDGSRLVPPRVVLANTDNERNFDKMIPLLEAWSVWDNDVPKGKPPKLVTKGGKS